MKTDLIIYFAGDFDADKTSRHYLAHELAKNFNLLWIESFATRNFDIRRGDFTRGLKKLASLFKKRSSCSHNKNSKGVKILTPMPLPFPGIWAIARFNEWILLKRIRSAIGSMKFKNVILWISYPQVRFAIGKFNERVVVYHSTDDYAQFAGVDEVLVRKQESLCIEKADIVFCAIYVIYEQIKKVKQKCYLIPHAVEFDLFSQATKNETLIPEELKSIKRPILGFYGLLDEFIDLDLVENIAQNFKDCSLVLIGKCNIDVSRLKLYSNIYLVSRKTKAELPSYCRYFDLGLVLYRKEHIKYRNPIKLKEYLAAGLPVVTFDFPDLGSLRSVVFAASDKEEFLGHIRAILADSTRGSAESTLRRQNSVRNDTWESIGSFIHHQLTDSESGS